MRSLSPTHTRQAYKFIRLELADRSNQATRTGGEQCWAKSSASNVRPFPWGINLSLEFGYDTCSWTLVFAETCSRGHFSKLQDTMCDPEHHATDCDSGSCMATVWHTREAMSLVSM
ncbi:hypothetical protein PAXRUDRAFT_536277 [Paxillus rubicundulus Ve08.2h10]|uniref:Uncharacterized protein n=1 Tax=Paxillus rubicundulus Ve08.2h10 TaxID=930991 RepID=A0A0D0D806_9AGAM|nr:hypothetical protein PAXRUDRAFT_536277 [Paxillus rubicundulus Ve08.2h10]